MIPWSIGLDLIQQADGKLLATASVPDNFVAAVRFDDAASYPGRIGLTNTSEFVAEETAPSVTYTVRRSGGKTGHVSVDYETVAGSAQQGSDFVAASGTFDWNDGDASDRSITIDLIDDELAETPEDFSLVLTTPTGGARLAASEAITNIQSTDGPGQLALILASSRSSATLASRKGSAPSNVCRAHQWIRGRDQRPIPDERRFCYRWIGFRKCLGNAHLGRR